MDWWLIVLAAMLVIYLWEMLELGLERRSVKNPMPANVADVYDAETFAKWKAYKEEKTSLAFWSKTAGFLAEFLLMALCAYAAFAKLFPPNVYLQMLAVLLLSAAAGFVQLPFDWYDTMKIEEKYGFNRSSKKTFIADQVKQFLLGLLLTLMIGGILMGVHRWLGDGMILLFAGLLILLVLLITFLFPVFSRIFNKFKPLPEGELREKLTALLTKHGFRVREIQVMDASRRTTKSNAYFTGFGKMKTIVLYDTILENMTPDQICAVFAHELGHGLHRDTLKNQLLNSGMMLLIAVLAWLTVRTLSIFTAFGFGEVNYGFALLLIMSVWMALISPLWGLVQNACSRRAEYRADASAVAEGYGDDLISALKRLYREDFGDLAPDPLLVKLTYSHPTLSQRITAIEALRAAGPRNPDQNP